MGKSEHEGGKDGGKEEKLEDFTMIAKKHVTSKKKTRKRKRPIDWGSEKVSFFLSVGL